MFGESLHSPMLKYESYGSRDLKSEVSDKKENVDSKQESL